MKKILTFLTITSLFARVATAEPAVSSPTAANSDQRKIMLNLDNAPISQVVDLYSTWSGGSAVFLSAGTSGVTLKSTVPLTKAEARTTTEMILGREGYFAKTIGDCFVCIPKDKAWTVKSFTTWPKKEAQENTDIFYSFTSTPVVQVFEEYAALLGRKVLKNNQALAVVNIKTTRVTKAQARTLLEIAFAAAGFKPELVGANEVKLVRLQP